MDNSCCVCLLPLSYASEDAKNRPHSLYERIYCRDCYSIQITMYQPIHQYVPFQPIQHTQITTGVSRCYRCNQSFIGDNHVCLMQAQVRDYVGTASDSSTKLPETEFAQSAGSLHQPSHQHDISDPGYDFTRTYCQECKGHHRPEDKCITYAS